MMDDIIKELKPFLNDSGQLVALPAKHKKRLIAYYYLATKIEVGQQYSESDINDILNQWAMFNDPATLRRELYDRYLLNRTNDGKCYWKEENQPSLEVFIGKYI